MNKTSIVVLSGVLFIAAGATLHAEMVSGVEVPSVAEMKEGATDVWGFHLDLVQKRQGLLRGVGVSNDVTFAVIGLQGAKKKMREFVTQRIDLLAKIEAEKAKMEKERKSSLLNRFKAHLSSKPSPALEALNSQLATLDNAMKLTNGSIAVLTNKIMKEFGLAPEAVAKIPALQ